MFLPKIPIRIRRSRWKFSYTVVTVAVLATILVWLKHEALWTFIDFIRDREAIVAFLDQLGFIGPLVFMALIGLQVLIASLPAEPLNVAGAYVYGFVNGFLMSWLVSVAVSQAVFYLARHTGRQIVERFVPANMLDKWTRIAGEKGMIFFMLAFVIPPVPSDLMNYVAGLSAISGRRFFVANLFGRIPVIALFTLVGANGFSITPTIIVGLTVFGVLMLMAWWYYIVRERPDAAIASRSALSNADHSDIHESPPCTHLPFKILGSIHNISFSVNLYLGFCMSRQGKG